jgi:hypothetical protein
MKFRLIIMVLLFGIFVAGAAAMVSELGVYPSQTFTASLPADDSNGSLYVTSYPTGATILINGTDYGTTNKFVNNVPVGIQNLTLIKAGYLAKTMMVNVPAGEVKILAPITLTKGEGPVPHSGTGSLYVASYPTNATILIDDTDRGMTDQLVSNVSAGDRTLTLTKVGYNATTMTVNVPANDAKILAPITLTKSGDGMQGGDGLSGGENGLSYTFDVLHGWNPIVAGQINIQNINTSTPTYSVTIQGIEPNKQHWLFYTTASGDKQFVTTDFTMKDGIWRHSGVWSNSIDDLMASPIFVLQDVPQSTSLALVASKTDLEVSEQVTFTATLIQIDLRTGNQAPLNGQEVYILASDLSRNLCTPGPNGTYTWTTTITSLGNNTYNSF